MSDPRAEHDREQMHAALCDLAGAAYAYYKALFLEGFTTEQALLLTSAWVTAMIAQKKEGQ